MAEIQKSIKEQEIKNELLKFTENLENMKQYATAVENIFKITDL